MTDLNPRDAKLVQYLNEAYGKEKELEQALEAHIRMTTRAPYRKRLQEHLRETKRHGDQVSAGSSSSAARRRRSRSPGPDVFTEAAEGGVSVAQRALALAKGPLHAVRGTSEPEKMLKNAKTEYSEEAEEIANYTAIEAAREHGRRQGDRKAGPGDPPSGGAHGELPQRLIPQLVPGGRQGGDPGAVPQRLDDPAPPLRRLGRALVVEGSGLRPRGLLALFRARCIVKVDLAL